MELDKVIPLLDALDWVSNWQFPFLFQVTDGELTGELN